MMRAFVRLRELLSTHKDLARKLEQVERTQKQHTSIIKAVVEEIKKLKAPLALIRISRLVFSGLEVILVIGCCDVCISVA